MQNPSKWSTSLQKLGKHSQNMIVNFQQNELSLEEAHNNVRRKLYNQSPSCSQVELWAQTFKI